MKSRTEDLSGKLLPFRKAHRTNPTSIRSGTYALVRAYYLDGLSRRSRMGRAVARLEERFARHLGYKHLGEAPITARLKVQLAIGNLLFLANYEPPPDSTDGLRAVGTAQNTLNRILTELGLKQVERPVDPLLELKAAVDAANEGGKDRSDDQIRRNEPDAIHEPV